MRDREERKKEIELFIQKKLVEYNTQLVGMGYNDFQRDVLLSMFKNAIVAGMVEQSKRTREIMK